MTETLAYPARFLLPAGYAGETLLGYCPRVSVRSEGGELL